MEWLNQFENVLMEFLSYMGVLAPIFCCLLVFLEGIFAFLPLFAFVTINILSLSSLFGTFIGTLLGLVLSWIFTILGSFTTFMLFRKIFSNSFRNRIKKKKRTNKFMGIIDDLKYSHLVLIISIPFSPSFFINLSAGLSKINAKKYFCSLIIGKFAQMLFLSFVGVSLVECLTEPIALIKVVVILVAGYILSLIVNKKFDLDSRFQ